MKKYRNYINGKWFASSNEKIDVINPFTEKKIAEIAASNEKDMIKEKGVYAPEAVVPCESFFKELAKRKMYVYENNRKIN